MNRLPDLEAWALFACTVEAGSFAKAAEVAGVSQSTVSKAISRLEVRLGATLLHRSPRGFSLTETGQAALEKANLILQAGESAEVEATEQASAPCGLVRVAAPVAFGTRYVAPLIPGFLDLYPRVTIELSFSDQFVDLFLGGYDLAVRMGTLTDSSLRIRKLGAVRRCLVASPAYLDRRGRPRHPRELLDHDCLILANRTVSTDWRFQAAGGGEYAVSVNGPLVADHAEALVPIVQAGLGVALLPEFLVREELACGRLETVLPDWSADSVALNLVTPPAKLRPARVNAVMDYLGQHLSLGPCASRDGLSRPPVIAERKVRFAAEEPARISETMHRG